MGSVAVSETDNFEARLRALQERLFEENLLNIVDAQEKNNERDALYTCGCCYEEVGICSMVQCVEGHLFCPRCLKRYVEETVFGQGKGELKCMTEDCQAIFPRGQLTSALPDLLYEKYENRVLEESINVAGLEDFVRCKFCNFGAELDATLLYFACTQCGKIFCRYCEELFEDHEGLTCEQIEKDGETHIRKTYEERMAEAKIRTCGKCKARFTKDDGCNLITCRCGTTMCYICRVPDIKYDHFGRECLLWSNTKEDEERAIMELRESARGARASQGYVQEKQIGPPTTIGVPCVANVGVPPAIPNVFYLPRPNAHDLLRNAIGAPRNHVQYPNNFLNLDPHQPLNFEGALNRDPYQPFNLEPILNQPIPLHNQPIPLLNQRIPLLNQPIPLLNQPIPLLNQPILIPNQPILIPNQRILIPNRTIPNQITPIINGTSHIPNQRPTVPNQRPTVPNQRPSVPNQKTPVPNQKTPVPNQETPVPNQKTPVPNQKTPVPNQETPVPNQKTPVPNQKTPVPNQKTPVPNQKTPVPNQKTPVPNQKTPVPNPRPTVPNQVQPFLLGTSLTGPFITRAQYELTAQREKAMDMVSRNVPVVPRVLLKATRRFHQTGNQLELPVVTTTSSAISLPELPTSVTINTQPSNPTTHFNNTLQHFAALDLDSQSFLSTGAIPKRTIDRRHQK